MKMTVPAIVTLAICLSISRVAVSADQDAAKLDQAGFVEWVESKRGRVDVSDGRMAVDLSHCWLTDADLDHLAQQSTLVQINLAYTKVTDAGLERLRELSAVTHLDLRYAENITDLGVSYLKGWPLEYLDLCGTKVSSSLFEHIQQIQTLRYLDVGFSRVNDDYFEQLVSLDALETFRFGGNKMSGVALPLLEQFPSLIHLDLSGEQRTDSGLWQIAVGDFNAEALAKLTGLKSLDLAGTNLSSLGVAKLAPLKQLESLDLSGTRCDARGLSILKGFQQLQTLGLNRCAEVDDAAIDAILACESLRVVELADTKLNSNALKRLAGLPQLEKLLVANTELSSEELSDLRNAMPQCRVSWWRDAPR